MAGTVSKQYSHTKETSYTNFISNYLIFSIQDKLEYIYPNSCNEIVLHIPNYKKNLFCSYNMKLKIRDMEAEDDKVAKKDFVDLIDISTRQGEEDGDQLFQWIRPIHLNDEGRRNP